MKNGEKFIYTDFFTKKQTIIYVGDIEVKGCSFNLFKMEDGTHCFFSPYEVCEPKFVKVKE